METVGSAAQNLGGAVMGGEGKTALTWNACYKAAESLWERVKEKRFLYIYGVPRGGSCVAALIQSYAVKDRQPLYLVDLPKEPGKTLIVDDLVDSGRTLSQWTARGYRVDALFRKPTSPTDVAPSACLAEGWLTFPWETGEREGSGAEDLVVRLLQYIGEDVNRDGLRDTPKRVLKAWRELTAGYSQSPAAILSTCFEQVHDELILLRGIEFHSTCEHHLLPFYGTASVGYIPTSKVVGISKLARLVDCFARRLQIQERMTSQIAEAIRETLNPLGVGVVVQAKHSCMGCRGVMKPDSSMVTSVMLGQLRNDAQARNEFLRLVSL